MSQTQMLRNEVLEEILRERTNYYFAKSKTIDFWVTISPTFPDSFCLDQKIRQTNFFRQRQKELLNMPIELSPLVLNNENLNFTKDPFYSALISSDKEFISWIRLRLGYFEEVSDLAVTSEKFFIENSNLKKKSFQIVSDGVTGSFEILPSNSFSPLMSNPKFLHPDILVETYKESLNLYYSLEKSL